MAEVQTLAIESPRSGPTLRACQSCAASKSKCVPATEETGGKCARCFKSKRDCIYQVKTAKKRKPSSTTAELEQKVQTLAALLASQQNAAVQQRPLPPTPDSIHAGTASHGPITGEFNVQPKHRQLLPSRPEDTWVTRAPVSLRLNSDHQGHPPPRSENQSPPSLNNPSLPPNLEISAIPPPEGQYLLRIFRDHFSRRFPFIVVPSSATAEELQVQRPWLFKAITIVASQDNRTQQLAWGKEFISELTISVMVNCERSLDILQGLIIYNAWSYSYAHGQAYFTSSAHSQLAIALVFDLGLNRVRPDPDSPVGVGSNSRSSSGSTSHLKKSSLAHSNDEKRALLSVYFLTNMLAWTLKRIEGLQYSPYLDECRRSLLASPEEESDLVLASLVKLQAIIEKGERNFLDCSHTDGNNIPIWLHSEIAILEFQAYWSSLSTDLKSNAMLITNYHAGITYLLEPCVTKSFFPRDLAGGNLNRVRMLRDCLIATKQLLDHLLDLPISDYFTFSVHEIACIGQGYILLLKLSLVEELGWDLEQFRNNASFREYFRKLKHNMQQVGLAIDQNQPRPCTPSFFTSCSQKMDKVKNWYDAKISQESQSHTNSGNPHTLTKSPPPDEVGLFDDRFWEEFMLGGSFF